MKSLIAIPIVIFISSISLIGCATEPSTQGTTSQTQAQQSQSSQNQEQTTVVSNDASTQQQSTQGASSVFDETNGNPNSYANMASALEGLPDYAIGEDGLFQMVNTDYYYNENWYKGYAGMFTPEDIAGKTIGGYPVELPLQIYGSWSDDGREYFERVEDEHFGLKPKASLYRNKLDWMRIEYQNYKEQTPYYEFDQEFRDMIVADDSLTTDQKLELIIKNHKGFIRNMEIGDLAIQNTTELTQEEAEDIFYDFYGDDAFSTSPFTYYLFKSEEVRSFERVFRYDDNIFISYDGEFVDDETGEEFVEQIVSSFEVLKHRLPLIYDDVLAPSEDHYWRLNLIESSRQWSAVTQYYPSTSTPPRISFFPRTLEIIESYGEDEIAETTTGTLHHELIHVSIKSGNINNFQNADDHFNQIIHEFQKDSEKSELLTYSSGHFLSEILNFSYGGYNGAGIHSFYGYVDNTDFSDAWVGEDPMDYYVRIIDNRLGQ